jgi:hypothetical protein
VNDVTFLKSYVTLPAIDKLTFAFDKKIKDEIKKYRSNRRKSPEGIAKSKNGKSTHRHCI